MKDDYKMKNCFALLVAIMQVKFTVPHMHKDKNPMIYDVLVSLFGFIVPDNASL